MRVLLDPDDRVLLARIVFPSGGELWATPGGGVEPGESDEHALRRELAEEAGLDEFELGPARLEARPGLGRPQSALGRPARADVPGARAVVRAGAAAHDRPSSRPSSCTALRWWTPTELAASDETFAPSGCRSSSPRSRETGRLPRRSTLG